jgi:hypothetical protein
MRAERLRHGLRTVGLAAALLLVARPGTADDGDHFEIAGRAGYVTPPIHGGVNPFGGGFGARAGFVLAGFYVGGTVMDFLGGSDGGATDRALLVGLEAGYGLHLGSYVTVRPRLDFGDAILTHTEPGTSVDVISSATSGSSTTSTTSGPTTRVANVYLQPGVTTLFAWRHYFLAVDFDVLVVPGITYGPTPAEETTWLSYSVSGALGLRF